jgi:hypothetical protein
MTCANIDGVSTAMKSSCSDAIFSQGADVRRSFASSLLLARHNADIARVKLSRRLGPVGTALTLWDLWRRLPKRQRRWVAAQARKHGPRLAKQAIAAQRARRRRP